MRTRTTASASFFGWSTSGLALSLVLMAVSAGWANSPPEWLADSPNPGLIVPPPLEIPSETAAQPNEVVKADPACCCCDCWRWQMLPEGLIYQSYMAGVKEPRIAAVWLYEKTEGWIWDVTLGGRVGLVRYGSGAGLRPEGWQLDMEGAVFPRLDIAHALDLDSADFRYGVPLTYGRGRYQTKLAFYHLSSHLGDELMLRDPTARRINFRRDVLVWGHSFYCTDDLRLYGEVGYATGTDGGSEPLELQFGVDLSPAGATGVRPVPFLAVNGHLRQEVDFSGNLSVQAGWLWRGATAHMARMGVQYFNGKSDQFEFYNQFVHKIGLGMWYDF